MNQEDIKRFASQLRKPEGDMGIDVAKKMNEGNAPMNLHTLAVVNPQANDRILEIGMGNGFFVKNILNMDPSITYTGCDFSELMVAESTKINSEFVKSGRAAFVLGNANGLPFDDNSFNKLFTINTIYFWENPAAVLSEFRRVLTSNGSLIISARPKYIMEKYPVTQYGFTMYEKEEILNLLKENNFNPIEVTEVTEPPQDVFGNIMERQSLMVKSVWS